MGIREVRNAFNVMDQAQAALDKAVSDKATAQGILIQAKATVDDINARLPELKAQVDKAIADLKALL